ncbi:MAG TPA: D-alanine--D-alanine ligase family protein [Rectinemataceae bacterium]|nr:D-alanine--D-alanine ligase family protein [Rectinemataceae bacterium]
MKRVAILYGGKSGEHEVSLQSAASIVHHMDPSLFELHLIAIAKDGTWILQGPEVLAMTRADGAALVVGEGPRVFVAPSDGLIVADGASTRPLPCDCVFPVLHGTFGEDGTIQGLLEVAGLPYVGAPVMGSALGMDKEKAKRLWMAAGLPVVPFALARRDDLDSAAALEALSKVVESRFGWPAFAKPACAGSSVGASRVDGRADLARALREALEWDDKALVEPFVAAREIECSVLGNGEARAFPPGEIVSKHEFYDYEAKYIDPDGAALILPALLGEGVAERVMDLALRAYKALDLAGMARVDFFVDRKSGEILLNEVNTIPGFTSISMYPKMCETGGLRYADLIAELVGLAIERFEAKASLRYSFA